MVLVLIIIIVLAICFAGVLLVGAPYVPTLQPQVKVALELGEVKAGKHLIELGCGDGRVVLAAAQRGAQVTGYELNPLLALIAWLRTWRYRRQVKIVCGNFWKADWPPADVAFVFLLDRFMPKLDRALQAYPHKPVKLVSFAFQIPGKKPTAQKNGVYRYTYK